MDTTAIKNYLNIAIIIALLLVSYAAISFARSYGNAIDPTLTRSFSVSGEGKVVAVPDIAQFTFSVITEGGINLAELQKKNSEKINAINAFIKSKKIDDKDIKTEGYSVTPRYQYFDCSKRPIPIMQGGLSGPSVGSPINPEIFEDGVIACPPPEIVGYSIHQTIAVKIRDFNKIGDLLSGVVAKGANSVSQLYFTFDDPTKPQNEARAEAIEKAKEKAKAMARAGGFRIGRLLSINEGGYGIPVRYGLDSAIGKGGAEVFPSVAPQIEPGSEDVVVNITLVYEIK